MIELTDEQLCIIYGGIGEVTLPPVNVNTPVKVGVQTGVNTGFNVGVVTPVNLGNGTINVTQLQAALAATYQYQHQ